MAEKSDYPLCPQCGQNELFSYQILCNMCRSRHEDIVNSEIELYKFSRHLWRVWDIKRVLDRLDKVLVMASAIADAYKAHGYDYIHITDTDGFEDGYYSPSREPFYYLLKRDKIISYLITKHFDTALEKLEKENGKVSKRVFQTKCNRLIAELEQIRNRASKEIIDDYIARVNSLSEIAKDRSQERLEEITVNWRTSVPHLDFLSSFLQPSRPSFYYQKNLPEPVDIVVKRFVKEGMLVLPPLRERIVRKFTKRELRDLADQYGFRKSQKREVLVDRLIETVNQRILNSLLKKDDLYICSPEAVELLNQFVNEKQKVVFDNLHQIAELLKARDFDGAIRFWISFRQAHSSYSNVSYPYTDTFDPSVELLQRIFSSIPENTSEFNEDELEEIRLSVAMNLVFKVHDTEDLFVPSSKSASKAADKMLDVIYDANYDEQET